MSRRLLLLEQWLLAPLFAMSDGQWDIRIAEVDKLGEMGSLRRSKDGIFSLVDSIHSDPGLKNAYKNDARAKALFGQCNSSGRNGAPRRNTCMRRCYFG